MILEVDVNRAIGAARWCSAISVVADNYVELQISVYCGDGLPIVPEENTRLLLVIKPAVVYGKE